MGLEVATYIGNLVSSNPTGADRKLQGDDHIRLIKSVLQNCFGGFTGSVLTTGTNGGVANAYTLTPTVPLAAYVVNMGIIFTPTITSSGPSTINVSSLGAVEIRAVDGAALIGSDLVAGKPYEAIFDGTFFVLGAVTKRYIDQLAFSVELPLQTGNAGKFLTTDGTNASWTDTFGVAVNEIKGADIASAATVDLTTATGNFVHITGTTTIAAVTIPSGADREVIFDDILTLTHGANLDLITGANITTASGDRARFRGDGSVARLVSYQRASGRNVIPAGWTLLAPPMTPAAAANLDALSIFSSLYDSYVIVGNGIKPAVSDNLAIRVGVAGAADTGNNYIEINASVPGSATAATASWQLATNGANGLVLASGKGINFEVHMQNVFDTADLKSMRTITTWQLNATPTYSQVIKGGIHIAANALTGIRLFWLAGNNFAAVGEIRIYGIINNV